MSFLLWVLALQVWADPLSPQGEPGNCPLFTCLNPSTFNSTDLFCARKVNTTEGLIVALYEKCPVNYFCSIRQLYDSFFLDNAKQTFDCKQLSRANNYTTVAEYDPELQWNCSNNIQKQLAFGLHPKTCTRREDCELLDGTFGECSCAIRTRFRTGLCIPHRLAKTFDVYWVPCPTGYVEDEAIKLYLQTYYTYYIYTQVEEAICAQTMFLETSAVWNVSKLISLDAGEWLVPLLPFALLW